ncbi:hypothetical protein [Chryseobacterium salivictor]|uniref:Ribbon-helix-helix protein CopG domain-containing protein n=1 Tax=Chryseobacterium salivictor TaxID=2547600 RepID=A0A4P6ZEK3_9FLAO|nr:hypothetical protein [Chryseobacterium salivictor]QBO57988.1 hypothetical protein NBC122_01161 [Chryseobacterium salivictor]
MKVISLKIDESIFSETEDILKKYKKPRNRYINEALDYYNQMQKREILKAKLLKSSLLVREDNLEILKEFESLENDF